MSADSQQQSPLYSKDFNAQQDLFFREIQKNGHQQIKYAVYIVVSVMSCYVIYFTCISKVELNPIEYYCQVKNPIHMASVFLLLKFLLDFFPNLLHLSPLIISCISMVLMTERFIALSPLENKSHEVIGGFIAFNDFINISLMTEKQNKTMANVLIWSYYFIRIYIQYNYISGDMIFSTIMLISFNYLTARLYQQHLQDSANLYRKNNELMKQNYQKALDIVPQGILIIDIEVDSVVFANLEIYSLLGATNTLDIKQQLCNYRLNKFEQVDEASFQRDQSVKNSSGSSQDQKQNLLEFLINNSKLDNTADYIFKNKNLKQFIQVKFQHINANQLLVVASNITKIKELEKLSQKMKSIFFSSVAHELRTPLNTIIPITKKLKDEETNAKKSNYLKIVLNSAYHLLNVIEDALDISRLENKKFQLFKEEFNIRSVIDEVCSIMDFQIGQKKLTLNVQISNQVPEFIKTDQKRYKQVLFNLIGNAIKFTFKGGITVKVDMNDQCLVTEVQDSGIGIKDADILKLFQFFGQISESKSINRGGMGLGLTISKMIIQQLNGQIQVISKYQKGSKFIFTILLDKIEVQDLEVIPEERKTSRFSIQGIEKFKLKKASSFNLDSLDIDQFGVEDISPSIMNYQLTRQICQHPFSNNFSYHSLPTQQQLTVSNNESLVNSIIKNHKVMIVDDSSYNLFVMEELMKELKVQTEVYTAFNGEQAIDIIKLNINPDTKLCQFDVIFLDLQMPILDGYQTIEYLRNLEKEKEVSFSKTKIIALSATTDSQFKQNQNNKLFDQFMEKPVKFENIKLLFL